MVVVQGLEWEGRGEGEEVEGEEEEGFIRQVNSPPLNLGVLA